MRDLQKQTVLDEFTDYLEQVDLSDLDLEQQPDLNSLLTEMAGLKAEVKAESRHLKALLNQYSESLETLQRDNKALSEELDRYQLRWAEQKRETQRKMVLGFLDVYDRLAAGLSTLQQYKPVSSLFKHSNKKDIRFLNNLREGQEMSINRLEQLLKSYQVQAIATEGKILDPHTMTAVATVKKNNVVQGLVVEELRKGFYFEDSVLRLAEVKVNKTNG